MKPGLRRFGILTFATLSLMLWLEVSDRFSDPVLAPGSGFMILMLGSCLACLTALLMSGISTWGRRLVDPTRHEYVLTELIDGGSDTGVDSLEGHLHREKIAWNDLLLDGELDGASREWIDQRPSVVVEGTLQ